MRSLCLFLFHLESTQNYFLVVGEPPSAGLPATQWSQGEIRYPNIKFTDIKDGVTRGVERKDVKTPLVSPGGCWSQASEATSFDTEGVILPPAKARKLTDRILVEAVGIYHSTWQLAESDQRGHRADSV